MLLTRVLKNRIVCFVMLCLPAATACSQTPSMSTTGVAQQIRQIIRSDSSVLPPGDTSVTWTHEPILYHTSNRTATEVTAGLLRNDFMSGSGTVIWADQAPISFTVTWTKPGTPLFRLNARVAEKVIRITGSRDTALAIPASHWAVADYGMDDLLLPAFDNLSSDTITVSVLRPYSLKWDQLRLTRNNGNPNFTIVTMLGSDDSKQWIVVKGKDHILWMRRSDQPAERRPLEGTKQFPFYESARRSIGDFK